MFLADERDDTLGVNLGEHIERDEPRRDHAAMVGVGNQLAE